MSGATRSSRLLSAAGSVNATVAQNGPCELRAAIGYNARASAVYLKLYSLVAAGTAPASTDTPEMTIELPPSAAFAIDIPGGYQFNFGCGYRLTTGSADNDTGALTAADIRALNLLFV